MGFQEKYTTSEKISREETLDLKDLPPEYKKEKDKVLISNDAFVIAELLECLINRGLK